MSSLKMTFSLASLVLILGLIAMPVMAQDVVPLPNADGRVRDFQRTAGCYADERFTVLAYGERIVVP